MKIPKLTLLPQIAIAILLGVGCGFILPTWAVALSATFNALFSNLLQFSVPLIILGLVAPAIADLGRGAGRMLLLTAVLAYGFTIFSGFFTYFSCSTIFPRILGGQDSLSLTSEQTTAIEPFFTVEMPPIMGVMSALIAAFIIGLGISAIKGTTLKSAADDFREVIMRLIERVIIPLLSIYIFGIFLNITVKGEVASVMGVFLKIIIVIFALTIILLLLQFTFASALNGKSPLKMLRTMLPAYMTALGTQSSAATIPVTLEQTQQNGVSPNVAGFVVPLCATIHLSGSTLKIVACAMAIMVSNGMAVNFGEFAGFILMLGITMVAAPGVPGGAIMAAIGVLQSMLGFDQTAIGLMIALYIAMDSFGTACNVTGDGAIAVIVDKIAKRFAPTS